MSIDARRLIDVAEAEALIAARLPDWGTTERPLAASAGEVLRQRIVAERDQPPFDRVTMDGIALRHAGVQAGTRCFRLAGVQGAGSATLTLADDNSAVAVMTGAALPAGADTVVPVERTTRGDGTVSLESGYLPAAGQFIHRRASDHAAGVALLEPGTRLGPAEMAILTAGGGATVTVARRPRIAVIATGDELVEPGAPLGPNQIRASNEYAVEAALAARGFAPVARLRLPDDEGVLRGSLSTQLDGQDVLVLSGGVSMGDFDYVPRVLDGLGMRLVFHKVLQQPGKPLWFGVSPGGQPIFALPGNPVATLVCTVRYVLPALERALGAAPATVPRVRLAADHPCRPELTAFLPVKLRFGDDGQCEAWPRPTNTSGDFIALRDTDGFVELPRGRSVFPAGHVADFYAWQ